MSLQITLLISSHVYLVIYQKIALFLKKENQQFSNNFFATLRSSRFQYSWRICLLFNSIKKIALRKLLLKKVDFLVKMNLISTFNSKLIILKMSKFNQFKNQIIKFHEFEDGKNIKWESDFLNLRIKFKKRRFTFENKRKYLRLLE
ncbi:hypothetical protein BpHYR1_007140 [Brachionus plicatilis]|uniref:Uncharacterized protein n=1 Tax=Brachionus plicatilis TaxID=10195 RepID=A0A3M7SQ01_BRAPC|nr:hypothetical protein BpHYR1_007140 [Brachionus plicatilis]